MKKKTDSANKAKGQGKRWIRYFYILVSVILILSVFLVSCDRVETDTRSLCLSFAQLNGAQGRVYSSKDTEESDGYISKEMEKTLYISTPVADEYSVYMYSSLAFVRELGVFSSDRGRHDALVSLAVERLSLLEHFSEGEGFIYRHGCLVIYGFFEDAQAAREQIISLI